MNQINAQTPGILHASERAILDAQGICIAEAHQRGTETPNPDANARLLASAYTAFDKAGRELGLDAATLAESIDLAALIRAAQLVRNGWSTSDRTKASAGEAAILKVLAPVNALLP